MKTRILITGATGKTGLPLAQELAARKIPFRAQIHTILKEPLLRRWTADIVAGDFLDRDAMDEAFKGIEKVYLVTPPSPDMDKIQKALVDIAKKNGVKYIVKLSALGAAASSPVGLLRAHAAVEDHLRKSGIAWTVLQPHFFMENLLSNADSVIRDGTIYSPLGDARISAVSIADIAAVAADVLTGSDHENRTYLLTGPEALSYGQIAGILTEVLGRKIVYAPVTFEAAQQAMVLAGAPEPLAEDLGRLMRTWTEGRGSLVSPDVKNITGRPPISVKELIDCHKQLFIGKAASAA